MKYTSSTSYDRRGSYIGTNQKVYFVNNYFECIPTFCCVMRLVCECVWDIFCTYFKIFYYQYLVNRTWHYMATRHYMTLYGNTVEGVTEFCYLGSIQSSSGRSRADILRRIGIASSAMHSMPRVWRQRILSLSTNLRLSDMRPTHTALRLRDTDTASRRQS